MGCHYSRRASAHDYTQNYKKIKHVSIKKITVAMKKSKGTMVSIVTLINVFRNSAVQVNLCQKLLFLHQLTYNMMTDFSLNYQFST
jgi:hypothetical protein